MAKKTTKKAGSAIKRRKPAEQRRSAYLRVRLTREQQELLREASARAGITVSSWAVERLVREAREEIGGGKK